MWIPTEDDAVEMFARYFHAVHKDLVSSRAKKTAESLKTKGDLDGHEIWSRVAGKIERRQQVHHQSQKRHAQLVVAQNSTGQRREAGDFHEPTVP